MPFVDKSEIKSGSEITEVNYGREAYRKCIRVGTAACGRSSHGSLEMRGTRNTLGKMYRKTELPAAGCQIMWKRLCDNLVREKLRK